MADMKGTGTKPDVCPVPRENQMRYEPMFRRADDGCFVFAKLHVTEIST